MSKETSSVRVGRLRWLKEQFWHVPLHTVITVLVGQYDLTVAWLWGPIWESAEWGVKLSARYKRLGPEDIIDSFVDLLFWVLGPFLIIQFNLYFL